jgi:hypothetical protein
MSQLAACTIITKSYLPYARTLASSLAEHNPAVNLYVLLADRVDGYFDPSLEPFKFIYLEDLPDPEIIEQMCFYYTPFELCCALRGVLHEYMFERTDARKWLFLDSDIMVHNSLDVIFNQLENSSILLTPHSTTPLNSSSVDPCELNFLRNGLYNAGFLGLQRTDTTKKFISWFKNRLNSFSFNDYSSQEFAPRGLFVDQLWLNLVPLYFKEVGLCLDPGANLGHWNLVDRFLSKDSFGNITANGELILFTHFSGWDINSIDKVSKYSPICNEDVPSLWIEISKTYRRNLFKNGHEDSINYPYAFNYFHNGDFITSQMRRKYYDYLLQQDKFLIKNSPFSNELNYWLSSKCNSIMKNSDPSKKTSIFTNASSFFKSIIKNKFH